MEIPDLRSKQLRDPVLQMVPHQPLSKLYKIKAIQDQIQLPAINKPSFPIMFQMQAIVITDHQEKTVSVVSHLLTLSLITVTMVPSSKL